MTKLVVNLPLFPGFYESILSQSLDHAVTSEAENLSEREESQQYYPETYFPEELRLDYSFLWEFVNHGDAYRQMAKDYAESFDQWMNVNCGTPEGAFAYESMIRPREYNYTTDRLFVEVPLAVMQSLFAGIDRAKLAQVIESRHSSRDGFASFYSNDIESWELDDLESLDHNELGTILCAAIAGQIDGENEFNWTLCESIIEQDYTYLDANTDWEGLQQRATEERAKLLAAIIESDIDHAARLIASDERIAELETLAMDELDSETKAQWAGKSDKIAYRCPVTADLFGGGAV